MCFYYITVCFSSLLVYQRPPNKITDTHFSIFFFLIQDTDKTEKSIFLQETLGHYNNEWLAFWLLSDISHWSRTFAKKCKLLNNFTQIILLEIA